MSTTVRCTLKLALSVGQAGDAPQGRQLLKARGRAFLPGCPLRIDRAYEGNETRHLVVDLGLRPSCRPNLKRVEP